MLKKAKLRKKIFIFAFIISLIPAALIAVVGLFFHSASIEGHLFDQLRGIREMKKMHIQQYLNLEVKSELQTFAHCNDVKQTLWTMENLINSYPMVKFDRSFIKTEAYKSTKLDLESKYPLMEYYVYGHGYYDVFIINLDGDILYTVVEEPDLGTNLKHGTYKDSGLARAWQGGLTGYYFEDFSNYSPSNNDPAAFVAIPIKDQGEIIAVAALQLSIDRLNQIMQEQKSSSEMSLQGLGYSGETYLVGADFLMRSNSRFSLEGELSPFIINPEHETTILNLKVHTKAIQQALSGNSGEEIIDDYRGVSVLSAYSPLEIEGLSSRWVIAAEIDEDEAFSGVRSKMILSILSLLILAVVIVLVGSYITRQITEPLHKVNKIVKQIAEGKGDLTKRIEVVSQDEVSEIAHSVNQFLDFISHTVQSIKRSIHELREFSSTITESTDQNKQVVDVVASAAQDQAAAMEESTTAASQVDVMIKDIKSRSKDAVKFSQEAHTNARTGVEAVNSTIEGMNRIKESSEKIGSIVELITDIANKTDLLSLNAAIEAAKAGEKGKGFAVVADEVRKLAERSNESAKEITELVQESTENVNSGVKLANNAGVILQGIIKSVHQTEEINNVMSEQASHNAQAVTEILQSLEQLSGMSENNAASAEEMASTNLMVSGQVSSLPELAARLEELVSNFIVKENEHEDNTGLSPIN